MERAPFLDNSPSRRTQQRSTPLWRSRRIFGIPILVVAPVATLVILVFFLGVPAAKQVPVLLSSLSVDPNYQPGPMNTTLGFGAILLMSPVERTDRRDALSLISSMSGIQVTETIYAVNGKDISEKAQPQGRPNIAGVPLSDAYLGSWRTYMDALKYVVDNRIQTALLFGDDVDWDVRIKLQMAAFSRGLATSPLRNKNSTPVSDHYPYGTDWNIMHLGPAYVRLQEEPYGSLKAVYEDEDVAAEPGCLQTPSFEDLYCWDPLLEHLEVPKGHRVIVPTWDSVGLTAIAVTYEGAQKILYQLSWVELPTTLDWSISGLVQNGKISGWTPLPPLFSQFKVEGNHHSGLDGNNATFFDNVKSNKDGFSLGLERSARAALENAFEPKKPLTWTAEYWELRGVDFG